ncbi:MAG: hypothetical protein KAG61_02740 [Bacteriovoracaceae bacterium]|nr:hypothetical protein [Bacteriovoracaceae bacterium]
MREMLLKVLTIVLLATLVSCDFIERIEAKSEKINRFETAALNLSKDKRALQVHVSKLEFEIQALKAKNNYLSIQIQKKRNTQRKVASVAPKKKDAVKFQIYKWTPSQLLAMAENEFTRKNFDKSSQYFYSFRNNFKGHKEITDKFLFQSGIAAYESGKHNKWAEDSLKTLISQYPTSQYYRGAKLWLALTNLRQGKRGEFFNTVEEFRKKYRNTQEWKILSVHYEEIVQKYKD